MADGSPDGRAVVWATNILLLLLDADSGKEVRRITTGLPLDTRSGHMTFSPDGKTLAVGLDRGVWFRVREGVRGVMLRDEQGQPIVYVLVEPPTHYYEVMTRSEWMPALVGELI